MGNQRFPLAHDALSSLGQGAPRAMVRVGDLRKPFEELRLAIKIPPENAARAYGDIAAASVMEKDEWLKDGSWVCVVRIPAGIQVEFYDLINKLSKGEGQVKILNQVY